MSEIPGLAYGGDSIAARRGWRTYRDECVIADAARARQFAEEEARAKLAAQPLQRIDGYVSGWLVQSNGTVLARFFGAGSKRRALALAKDRGLS